jgi:hypothetical protein
MAIINVTPNIGSIIEVTAKLKDVIVFTGTGEVRHNNFTVPTATDGVKTSFYVEKAGRYDTSKGNINIKVNGFSTDDSDFRKALGLDYNHPDNYVTFKDNKTESNTILKAIEDSLVRHAVDYTLATGVEIYNGNNSETYVVKNGQHVELTMLLINKTGGNIAANTTLVTIHPGDKPGRSKVFSGLAGTSFGSMTPVAFHLSGFTGELQCYTVLPANTYIVIDSSYMLPPVV